MEMMAGLTKGKVLRYMLLPQIAPRIGKIASSGFGQLAYLMALVYRAVNILPAEHPYLRSSNVGHYGLRAVIAEAANHTKFTFQTIDQVIIFVAILAAMAILFIQFALLLVLVSMGSALAQQPSGYGDLFNTKNMETDLAIRILGHVFGVEELFGGGKGSAAFHTALHALFQFYSVGLLVVAVLIIIYFIFAILAETAQTGTPFGKRFKHVWAPIRLVVAIGLLIPMGYGLNAAQWITLYAAKFGSAFASNGWAEFNKVLGDPYKVLEDDQERLIAIPNSPEIQHLGTFMTMVRACKIANEQGYARNSAVSQRKIEAFLVKDPAEGNQGRGDFGQWNYTQALDFFQKGDIRIRFGQKSGTAYPTEKGYVKPWCGEIVLQTTSLTEPGAVTMQKSYYSLIKTMWDSDFAGMNAVADAYVRCYMNISDYGPPSPDFCNDKSNLVSSDFKVKVHEFLKKEVDAYIEKSAKEQVKTETWKKDQELLAGYGWAGAGVWYNKIAQINGAFVAGVDNIPRPSLMPAVMEDVKQKRLQQNRALDPINMYNPKLADNREVYIMSNEDLAFSQTMNNMFQDWVREGIRADSLSAQSKLTGNAMIDAINLLFGTQGLFDMCKNADIHPLAQLANVGKGLVEHSIINFGFSAITGVGGIALSLFTHVGAGLSAASGFFVSIGMIGLVAGFILFYIIPFLPFLYFFFAVGEWIKGLFEAMVGVPLWALAHLRIDGEGLPGDAAMNGYYLIFEVFLRPMMIIFGLLASISIFAAMVKVLNEIFYLAVSNLSGFNPETAANCKTPGTAGGTDSSKIEFFRGPVDEFFFTILYTIIVYMTGMSCFKLIDQIPDNILRWMGTGVNSFGKSAGDQAEGFVEKLTVGGGAIGSQLKGAVSQASSSVAKAADYISGKPEK